MNSEEIIQKEMGKLPEIWLDKLKQKNIWLLLELTEMNLLLKAKFLGSAPVPFHPVKRHHWQMSFQQLQFKVCLFGGSAGLADLDSSPFTTGSSLTPPICRAGTSFCTSVQKVVQGIDVAEKQQKVPPHSQGYSSGGLFPKLPEGCKGLDRELQVHLNTA